MAQIGKIRITRTRVLFVALGLIFVLLAGGFAWMSVGGRSSQSDYNQMIEETYGVTVLDEANAGKITVKNGTKTTQCFAPKVEEIGSPMSCLAVEVMNGK